MEFLHGKIAEESPYRNAVMESCFNAVGRSQRALTDRLLAALRDEDADVRQKAALALGQLGAATPDVVSGLLAALRDNKWSVRGEAAEALGKLGAATPEVAAGLLAALRDNAQDVRFHAAQALGGLGAATPDVTAGLLAALRDNDEDVRRYAAQALERIVEQSSTLFLEGLRLALTGDDSDARRIAARVVGYYDQDVATLRTLENLAANRSNTNIKTIATDAAARYARKLALFGVSSPHD
jgi:HEAT repeat protein